MLGYHFIKNTIREFYIDFYLHLRYLSIIMKRIIYILLMLLVSSLVAYQGNATEDNTCAEALGFGEELKSFYAARDDFLKTPSYDNNDKVGILYDALGDKAETIPYTKLHIAALQGDILKIRYLVSNGMKVDVRGQMGVTPLSAAAAYGHIDAIDVLLELGADINAPDVLGYSPLTYAAASGHSRAVEHLLRNNVEVNQASLMDVTPIMFAVRFNHLSVFRILASHGADLTSKDIQGRTLLHSAIIFPEVRDRVSMVKAILDATALVDWPEPGIINWPTRLAEASPLHWVAFYGRTDVVNVLLLRGASLTTLNEDGELPIHVAARVNQVDIFLMLKNSNSTLLDAKDDRGRTPIDTARKHDSTNVLSALGL